MKKTFEVECFIHEIEKKDHVYFVQIETMDDRNLHLRLLETEDELVIEDVVSSFRIWHKEQVVRNVLAWILFSEQKTYWLKFIPEKPYIYNRKKLDTDDLFLRYLFIKNLPQIDRWVTSLRKSESTKDTYRRSLRVFLQYCVKKGTDLKHFGITDVQDFFKIIEKTKSEYYVEKLYFAISQYIKHQRSELETFFKEMVVVATPENLLEKAPLSLTQTKVNEMFRKLEAPIFASEGKGNKMRYFEALRNITIATLFFEIGLRLSELTSLNMDDLEMGKSTKTSKLRIRGKRNKIRYIPIPTNSRHWLNRYLFERKNLLTEKNTDLEALFISNQVKRMSQRSIYRIFDKFDIHPHQARHTLLTKLLKDGNDIVTVQQIAGHSNINTTSRYTKSTLEELGEALDHKR
ncbi:tyrosine-type recombinase/integrase [Bacillus gobiensis]|uniref:tyrosine-type recombinase/integrase n=1 Tax=Bacillus gobiensis TaxID=1441095 RepID=UPI003D19B092